MVLPPPCLLASSGLCLVPHSRPVSLQVNFQNALKNVSSRPEGAATDGSVDVFARRKTASRNYWATNRRGEAPACQGSFACACSKFLPCRTASACMTVYCDEAFREAVVVRAL